MDLSRPRQIVQLIAGVLLVIGLFLPVRAMRYFGNQTLFSEDPSIAVLLLVLGIVAVAMALRAATAWVPLIGVIAIVLVVIGLLGTIRTVNSPQRWPRQPLWSVLDDRPAYADVEPALRWAGWIVMLLGAVGLAASFFLPAQTEERAAVRTGPGRYKVTGFEQATGNPTSAYFQADSAEDAEERAVKDGIIVTDVKFEPVPKDPPARVT